MTSLLDAVRAVIAADEAFDPDMGMAYELLDAAAGKCRAAIRENPADTGPLGAAAAAFADWSEMDRADGGAERPDWRRYDDAIAVCRAAAEGVPA